MPKKPRKATPPAEVKGESPVKARRDDSFAIELSMSPAMKLVRNVVERHLEKEEQDQPPKTDDPVLSVIDAIVDGIKHGTDLGGTQDQVTKLISNQESRSELIDSLFLTHDYDRLIRYAKARATIENVLLAAAERNELTPAEALAFLSLVQTESKTIQAKIKAGATNVKNVLELLEKADYAVQVGQVDLVKKFSKTSPQGREIIRRLTYKLSQIGRADKTEVGD